jgi:TonB family protein
MSEHSARHNRTHNALATGQLCLGLGIATLALAACGDKDERAIKDLKAQVQVAYGDKQFQKGLELSQKGLTLARQKLGDHAPDTLYFAQAVDENDIGLHNFRAAIPAMKQEIALRAAAGQPEKKLQPRRTFLIKLAEENGDSFTAADQAAAIARSIKMAPGKDPQPVYRADTVYPPDQYRNHVEGDVQIGYSLDAGGAVSDARVIKSTPARVFDQAALDSFHKWRFTPMLDSSGQPVSASGFNFTLAFRMGRGQ